LSLAKKQEEQKNINRGIELASQAASAALFIDILIAQTGMAWLAYGMGRGGVMQKNIKIVCTLLLLSMPLMSWSFSSNTDKFSGCDKEHTECISAAGSSRALKKKCDAQHIQCLGWESSRQKQPSEEYASVNCWGLTRAECRDRFNEPSTQAVPANAEADGTLVFSSTAN
jgi:hypothetical protein